MNKTYIAYLAKKNAELFTLLNRPYTNIYDSITTYMKSEFANRLDKEFDSYQDQSVYKWLDDFDDKHISTLLSKPCIADGEALYWLGYLYRYWVLTERTTSRKVISLLPVKVGLEKYILWHTYPFDKVIELAKNEYLLSKTAHNKYEAKKNPLFIDYDDPFLYQFLAKRILYKIVRDKKIDDLSFSQSYSTPSFYNHEDSISLYVTRCNLDNLKYAFDEENHHLAHVKDRFERNILFVFLKEEMDEEVVRELNKMRLSFKKPFSDIYLLYNNDLWHMDERGDYTKTIITISKADYNISQRLALRLADE